MNVRSTRTGGALGRRIVPLFQLPGIPVLSPAPDTGGGGVGGEVSGRPAQGPLNAVGQLGVASVEHGREQVHQQRDDLLWDTLGGERVGVVRSGYLDEFDPAAVLDRLLDLLLIAALREWFARPGGKAPAWYRAHGDPVVGRALQMLHNNPAHPWTVASLATRTGASRAALARRFTALVGEPPMSYLTEWRLALAADLLCEPDATVGAVAHQVGYGSSFALSAAFKRIRGVSPREHRMAVRV